MEEAKKEFIEPELVKYEEKLEINGAAIGYGPTDASPSG
jgi:hypothetical protein